MRDQTCAPLLGNGNPRTQFRSALQLVEGWTPLRRGLVGLIVALLGAYALYAVFGTATAMEDDSADSQTVVVARRYIPAFSAVTAAQVTTRSFPKQYVPPGVLHSLSELNAENGLALYGSAVAIPEGQPLTRSLLNELGRHHEMASLLPPGNVAVSFSVDPVRGVGGWIRPGDTIAIFEVADQILGRSSVQRSTRLLFSSVRVLAVDRKRVGMTEGGTVTEEMFSEGDSGHVLTVVLNAVEAARLIDVRERGHLSVMLRPLGDDAPWVSSHEERHE